MNEMNAIIIEDDNNEPIINDAGEHLVQIRKYKI